MAKNVGFEKMDMNEIDELEKKLVELKSSR